ncbi:hypothetical protein SH1V18_04460 [Vallitalea longa]|uniref:HAMP domain-containing protein n=1 Tax=Vallitalea longa TaxID=2936439 RepID=A0A9W5Y8H5_9FIRM|nr:histidine kinase [Vallitalea longa]GKX27966.1 hypothetical protein SH1V18_04460 [Vallitalea longa]
MIKKFKFQTKVFLSNIIIISFIMALLSICFYYFVVQVELDKADKNLNVYASKISDQYNDLLYYMDRTTLQLASNPTIIELFNEIPKDNSYNYFIEEPLITNNLIPLVISYNSKKDFTGRICLYNEFNDFFYSGTLSTNQEKVNDFLKNEVLDIRNEFSKGIFRLFTPPRDDPMNSKKQNSNNKKLFSIIRPIVNYSIYKAPNYGYIEIQQPVNKLDEMFTFLPDSVSGYIIDKNDTVIFSYNVNENISLEKLQKELYTYKNNNGHENPTLYNPTSKNKYLYSSSDIDEMETYILLVQPTKKVISSLIDFRVFILITAIIIICVVTTTQFLIIRKLTTPLRELRKHVNKVTLNNLSINIEHYENYNEFNKLNVAFNKMCDKLKESIDDRVKARTSELKSHLFALQSQMDPHFYHNILTIISVIADENNVSEITEICNKLSSMLRFSTSYDISQSTINEEIEHTLNYLQLMKIRYENLFTFDINVDEECKEIDVPKLIIQPLTENCFAHGFKKKRPPWDIKIDAMIKNDKWIVEVIDNGTGFSEESLTALNNFKDKFNIDRTHELLEDLNIGGLCLTNIFIRLSILYGDDMIFRVDSNQKQTKITIGGKINV